MATLKRFALEECVELEKLFEIPSASSAASNKENRKGVQRSISPPQRVRPNLLGILSRPPQLLDEKSIQPVIPNQWLVLVK